MLIKINYFPGVNGQWWIYLKLERKFHLFNDSIFHKRIIRTFSDIFTRYDNLQ